MVEEMCRPISLGRINCETKCASPGAVTVNARRQRCDLGRRGWSPRPSMYPCGTLLRSNVAVNCVNVSSVTLAAL